MTAISEEMTAAAFEAAKRVYVQNADKQMELRALHEATGMAPSSARDYVNNISKMLVGQTYMRTFNNYATDYILTKIHEDFGTEKYRLAIESVEKHADYYASLDRGHLRGIEAVAARHRAKLDSLQHTGTYFPDEIKSDSTLVEGAIRQVQVNAYERSATARRRCIDHYGLSCAACGFNFEKIYGDIGKEFIHVHHLVPIASIGEAYVLDPIRDLRPVCPNCHAMLHRTDPPLSIEELNACITNR